MIDTLQRAQGLLRRYFKMIVHLIAYFFSCLVFSIVMTGMVLLAWTVGGPAIALLVAGACIGFLVFGPVDQWLTSIIETGTVTLKTGPPDNTA